MAGRKVLLWFRKGLRVHDNAALLRAAEMAGSGPGGWVLPVFVLDPAFTREAPAAAAGSGVATSAAARPGPVPFQFLFDALADVDRSLRARGSLLHVARGPALREVRRLAEAHGADTIAFEKDTEPFALARDAEVRAWASRSGVDVVAEHGHTLFDLEEVASHLPGGAGGDAPAPATYSSFIALLVRAGLRHPRQPEPAPDAMPPPPPGLAESAPPLPTLAETHPETGGERPPGMWLRGGETEALRALSRFCADARRVARFEKPKTSPLDMDPASTTTLSPYMTHGCLSARRFYYAVDEAAARAKNLARTQPPVSLHGQLLWREFFYFTASRTPNFERMRGNPICRQVEWGDAARDPVYRERLAAWREARTGFPWIDAAMTQLRQEGWIHHLARHAVACFLTRGDLWCSWEDGRDVFSSLLADGDSALNSGNWMWLSASSFFYQYFRIYSPVSFARKYDKTGAYVRKYLPQLRNMPDAYIYEPHKAPAAVQRKAGCVIGTDYPAPIVDHAAASKDCKDRMSRAYAAHKAAAEKRKKASSASSSSSSSSSKRARK